ncbi:MAG TPA: ABC transporter ATP-binding protein [Candidatus Saccharimonadales bacterium]|nr:ABC transporter ATP-binding protein [Candidatus Saccharimonadales bacterium]
MTDTEDKPGAIVVDNVTKIFKLPHENYSGIKQLLLNFYKRGNRGYELQSALKGVSLEVKKGDFFAIAGRNGSGKSTMLKLLAGIYSPTKGAIHVNGKLTPFIELGVGFNPELTGRENVYLNGALLGFNHKEMKIMYQDIVEFAELERFMDQKLKNYSSGMQVRLAFSIAIRAKSDILLLDEVLAVGDAAFQQKCYDYFEELKKRGQTVVFVSHDMNAVRRFCNRAVYIKDGELILDGTPEDVAELYMTENIESMKQAADPGIELSKQHTLVASKVSQTEDKVKMAFKYTSKTTEETYIAFSLIKDGVTIAEMTSSLEKPLIGSGTAHFTINTSVLNVGVYQLNSVLSKKDSRALLSLSKKPISFTVSGPKDDTRGGALRLADNWEY